MNFEELKDFLDSKSSQYNQFQFIEHDPISIPHSFSKKQDIEIAGFFASILAWGQRKTIINKCNQLIERMDNSPHDFILNHSDDDLKRFLNFKHRTFNDTDALYFIEFLHHHFSRHESLETAFSSHMNSTDITIENGLKGFYSYFFSLPEFPHRTQKHIATPDKKSACKRLSMYLRWMVRTDTQGVDFGLWKTIKPHQLICPFDVHVERVSRALSLIKRKQADWKTAVELTTNLKKFDSTDPVKYDFALFGLGIEEGFK